MKYKPLIAGFALTVVGLVGCSSSSDTAPAPGESGSNPSASAPAVEASSQAPAAPTKSLEEMLLTGEVAGLKFTKAPEDAQDQAGLADIAKDLPIKPAECKALVTQAVANATNAEAVVSAAQKGTEGYAASVMSNGPSISEARKTAEKCKTFTIDIGVEGVPAAKATTKISELEVDGVDESYLTVTSIEIGGQKQSTIAAVGQVGETTVSVSGAGTAKKEKVEEIFAAQVEKVNS